jgi:diguanylate cyclase (GGDEF)-like protein/PAS domain S-box-containing protein
MVHFRRSLGLPKRPEVPALVPLAPIAVQPFAALVSAAGGSGAPLLAAAVLAAACAASLAWGRRAVRRAGRAEQRLREAERRHSALVEDNGVGIWQVTPTGRTIYLNAAMCELLEIDDRAEMVGLSYHPFFTAESIATIQRERAARDAGKVSSYEVELLGRRGGRRHLMMSGAPVFGEDGALQSVIGTCLDITSRRQAEDALRDSEARLSHQADHDSLTDLLNRRRFERELRLALVRARRQHGQGALLWCDVDHFKHVSDSLGYRTGDDLLLKLAAALRANLRPGEAAARMGGDEFAVLLPQAGAAEAVQLAERLQEAAQSITVTFGSKPVRTTLSIGIVLFPEHGAAIEQLLSRADLAVSQAKRAGRNRWRMFDGGVEWQARLSSEMELAERLREALEGQGFELYLQPMVALRPDRTGGAARYEALLRLRRGGGDAGDAGDAGDPGDAGSGDDDSAVLKPDEFLGVAARYGMMREIDRWVIGAAIELIAGEAARGREVRIDVNLSGDAFADRDLLPWIEAAIATAGVAPRCLALEITETASVTDFAQARRFIEALQRLGCELAIDDFGVGFSSFYYLKQLPIDLLKIDGSFIHDLPRNPISQHLVRAISSMARGLGIRSVAEYVEDEETLVWARRHGVDYAQGFHLGRPRPAREALNGGGHEPAAGPGPPPAPPSRPALSPLDG